MNHLSPGIISGLERLDIHLASVSGPFPTGRPDRVSLALDTNAGPLVIKFFPPGMRCETFGHMTRIWQSSFGVNRSPPGLPRPVTFLEEDNALVMERLPGLPMVERTEICKEHIEETARMLVDLHTSDADPRKRRDAKRVVRSIQRKVEDLVGTGVEHLLASVADRLLEWLPEVSHVEGRPVKLVPSHGDFSARNVIVSPERIALIDWDRSRWADPVRDLAYFGAWSWTSDLFAGCKPDWTAGDKFIDIYRAYLPIPNIHKRTRFYRAAGLARIAHSRVRLWKSAKLVPLLTAEARRLLV